MTVEVINLQGKALGSRILRFSDDFQYTPSGAGELANYWTIWQLNDVASESVNPDVQISNGTLRITAGGGGGTWWNRVIQPQITGGLAGLSQTAQCTLVSGTGTNGVGSAMGGIAVLAQPWGIRNTIRNGSGNGYLLNVDTEPQNVDMQLRYMRDSDHITTLQTFTNARNYGSVYRITVSVGASSNVIKCYKDGVQLGTTTTDSNSDRPGGGSNGIGSQNDFPGVGCPAMFVQKCQPGFEIVWDNWSCFGGAIAP